MPKPVKAVKLIMGDTRNINPSDINGFDNNGKAVGQTAINSSSIIFVSGIKTMEMITQVVIEPKDADFCLLAVCLTYG